MASAVAPPPLPQNSTDKTFAAGSYIIDAGWMGISTTTQPKPEGLQPYGLLYQLLVTEKIPVYWIIKDGKQGQVQSAPSLTNTPPDLSNVSVYAPYTSTSLTTKSYYSGPFVIPAEYMNNTKLAAIIAAAGVTAVRVDKAAAEFTAPVYDKITYWPKAVLDDQNGDIAVGFYQNAKVPAAVRAYSFKAPSELNACDDIFVMPHADPTWATHNNLIPFNDRGGYIWAGCHAASVLENIDAPAAIDTDTNPNMNFLSTEGLLLFGGHGGGSIPYYYGAEQGVTPTTPGTELTDRSDPVMQFIGATELAHQNGSEQIYMPNLDTKYPTMTGTSGWNPTTPQGGGVRFVSWDATQADVIAGKSPGVAAADVYGRGFNDPTNGLVMYQGGHSINKGSAGDTPAQRAFFNFLLMGGIERAPEVEIGRTGLPSTFQAGGSVPLTANIKADKGTPAFTYTWESTCGGTFSTTSGTTAGGNVLTTWTAPSVSAETSCQVKIVVLDSCNRQVFDSVGFQLFPVADLKITKTSSPTVAPTGSNITYSLTVTNLGPASAAGVVVTDTLPAGLSYVSATPSPANVTGQVVTWNLGTFAKDATSTLTVTAKANQGGVTVQNTATVSATTPDPNPANNSAHANTQIINSGISITKVARPEIVPGGGGPVTYEFVVRNVGDNPLSSVVVTDNPACTGMNPANGTPINGIFNPGDLNKDRKLDPPYSPGVDREIWRFTCTETVNASTPDVTEPGAPALDIPDRNTRQNVVTVTAIDSANNALSAKASTIVTISTPGISVTKTLEPATQTPAPGDNATFRVLVSNTGNVPLTSVDTTDIWAGSCDTATIPNIPVGGSFSMVCQAATPTGYTASEGFDTSPITYGGGTGSWGGSWTEIGDGTSNPNNGSIQIVSATAEGLPAGYSSANVLRYAAKEMTVNRTVNLSGRTSATLRFSYFRSATFNNDNRNFGVYVSSNGTIPWTQVGPVTPTGVNAADGGWTTFEATIPAGLLTATTQVRFGDPAIDLSGSRTVYVDDVQILASQLNSVTVTGKDPLGQTVTWTATAPVQPGLPPLRISKSAPAGPLHLNDPFIYTVTVTNTDTKTQTGLVVTDTLPTGLTLNGAVKVDKPAFTQSTTDGFGTTTESYSTGSGWASSWTETGETTSASGGKVKVSTNVGNPKNSLYFNPDNNLYTIQRTVNLGGLTTADISFDCSRDAFSDDPDNFKKDVLKLYVGTQLVVTVDYQTLATVCPTDKGGTWKTISVPINTAQLVNGAVVKYEITGDKEAWIDNVTITGTGSVATNVTAGDPPTLTDVGGPYILSGGASMTFRIPVKVSAAPADGFQFSNVATAKSDQRTNPVAASVTTPYYLTPGFSITKTAIETWVNQSGPVLYRVELRNTGNAALTPVSVSDPRCNAPLVGPTGDLGVSPDGTLQIGEIWRYTCTRSVSTPLSVPAPDDVPNTVTATMEDPSHTVVTNTADANVKVIHPAIDLTVSPMAAAVLTGGHVAYTYTLKNTGDIDITNPVVTAANCSPPGFPGAPVTSSAGDTDNDGILDVTETWTYTCTTAALTASQTSQTVTATGKDLIFASSVTDTELVAVTVINPRISVVKTAHDNAPLGQTGDSITVGYDSSATPPNSVTYLYDVKNTGDVALSPPTGIDNKCSPLSAKLSVAPPYPIIGDDGDNAFEPNETWLYTCGPVALDEDTTNSAQFNANYDVNGFTGTVPASDTAHVEVRRPGIRLTKSASTEYVRLGGEVTYTYLVLNTGGTSFFPDASHLGALADDKCSPVVFTGWVHDGGALGVFDPPTDPSDPATGDLRRYSCTATITAGMLDLDGRVTNIATMGPSVDTFGSPYTPTPSSASAFVINPDFIVTKQATTALDGPGTDIVGEALQPVTYTFTVAHTLAATGGSADVLNALQLTVTDPKCDAGTLARDITGDLDSNALLNPGETWTYTCALASLPDGDPTVNTVTVVGTVVARELTCDAADPPSCSPAEPDDGLGPITHTATATVTPLSVKITVEKRSLNCDVGVPVCDSDIPGTEFTLYDSDPLLPGAGTGEILPNTPTGSATFLSDYVLVNHDYWLVETKAPAGFQLLAEPIKFHVTTTELTLDPSTASSLITADAETFTITVTDVPGADLPEVGGNGIVWYLAIGLLLIAAAGLYYRSTSGPPRVSRRAM